MLIAWRRRGERRRRSFFGETVSNTAMVGEMRKILTVVLLSTAMALVVGCGKKTSVTASEYCSQLPKEICGKLFKKSCLEDELGLSSTRYGDKSECEREEKKVCEELRADASLTYNGAAAQECLDVIAKRKCSRAARGEFGACHDVFTEIEPPVTDLREDVADDDDSTGDDDADDDATADDDVTADDDTSSSDDDDATDGEEG